MSLEKTTKVDPLGLSLAVAVVSGVTAAVSSAPFIAIVDAAITSNASGREPLWSAIKVGLFCLISRSQVRCDHSVIVARAKDLQRVCEQVGEHLNRFFDRLIVFYVSFFFFFSCFALSFLDVIDQHFRLRRQLRSDS
jgi:hypothetical protein